MMEEIIQIHLNLMSLKNISFIYTSRHLEGQNYPLHEFLSPKFVFT